MNVLCNPSFSLDIYVIAVEKFCKPYSMDSYESGILFFKCLKKDFMHFWGGLLLLICKSSLYMLDKR